MSSRIVVALIVAALLPAGGAHAFGRIVAFGDSLSDLGASPAAVTSAYKLLGSSCHSSFPCPPYFEGRISNGPVAVESLARLAGLNAPGLLQGYAIGGAMTNAANYTDPGAPGMQQQVSQYLGANGGSADAGALYVLWGGANDFSNAVATGTLGPGTASNAVDNLTGYVTTLIASGAREFLIPNLPDLSLTPSARAAAAQADAIFPGAGAFLLASITALSDAFNTGLAASMSSLDAATPASIKLFDTAAFVDDAVANPSAYGLSNVTDPCLVGAVVCADPEAYLFWDGSHPTAHAHALLGERFFATAVPEPRTWILLGIGFLVVWIAAVRPAAAQRPR